MKFLVFLALASTICFVQADLSDFVDQFGLKDKLKEELQHLKEIAQAIKEGKEPKEIVKLILQQHPGVRKRLDQVCNIDFLKNIEYVKKACDFLQENPTPAQQRGLLDTVTNKFKQELQHLKQIYQQITQGKSPVALIKELAKKGYTKALSKVCSISFARRVEYIDQACKALENAGEAQPTQPAEPEPVPEQPVADEPAQEETPEVEPVDPVAPHTRGFGSFFGKVTGVLGNVPILGDKVQAIKALVEAIKGKKDPAEIAQAVLKVAKPDELAALCNLPLVSAVPGAGDACAVIKPLNGIIGQFAG